MTQENEAGNGEAVEEIEEIVETKDGDGNDTTDWKALALKNQGIAKRYQTKLQKQKEVKPEVKPTEIKETMPTKKSDELDYGQKAFLAANDIKVSDEVTLVKNIMKDTGKNLEQVLESKYFQAELKEMRELRNTEDAMPSKSKRSNNSAKDSADYWVAKGELPPADQIDLRRKVIAERRKKDTSGNPFKA